MTDDQVWIGSKPDLRLLARALKETDKTLERDLKKLNRQFAKVVTDTAQDRMRGLGGQHASQAGAVTPVMSGQKVAVRVASTRRHPYGLAAFWGAQRRTGWYAADRYAGGAPNLPAWVGNQWTPGDSRDEPYGLGPAIRERVGDIVDAHSDAVEQLIHKAWGTT